MKLVHCLEFLRRHRRVVVRLGLAALLVLVVVDAIPLLVNKEHAHTNVERMPGFWALFGLLGCMAIIVLSKAFGHLGIMTREDYYDDE